MADEVIAEIGTFSPEQARELWQEHLRRKQLPSHVQQHYPQRRTIDEPSPHRVFVYNTSGETIPAYACMRIKGVRNIGNATAIDVEKPTSTSGEFLFNCHYPIAVPSSSESGVGWAYRFGQVLMLGDVPSVAGEQYLPIVGSWEIVEGQGPFVVFGRHRVSARALTGRFGGSSGGTHEIWFVISSVICNANGTMTLVVTPTYYTGGCKTSIPGQDSYGHVVVEDICSILSYYTATWLGHGGVIGRATYMYPRTGYCVPVWLVDQICGQPTCG